MSRQNNGFNFRLQVADSRGHTLFRKEDANKGKFAFTTEDYEMFEVCFFSTVTGQLPLQLQFVIIQRDCQELLVIALFPGPPPE